MKRYQQLVSAGIVVCLLCGLTAAKAPAQATLFARVSEAAAGLLEAVGSWNKAIDKLTDTEARKQLQRRMYPLYRQMQDLERKKQNLLESVLADRYIRDNVETDIAALQEDIKRIRLSLDRISAQLGTQQSFDGQQFERLMNDDLNEKAANLIRARRERNKDKLAEELQAALAKIRDARKAVGDCLKNLEKDM